jgi:HEPN domain-containing protein
MKPPNEEVAHKFREWLAHADEDLRLATYALKMRRKTRPYRLIAYHAQQCAEKCIKGYLVSCGVDFPYTHNISILLEICSKQADWAQALRDAEELSQYAITARYPGEDEPVTKEQAQKAVETAQKVRKQVWTALAQHGMDLPAVPEQ